MSAVRARHRPPYMFAVGAGSPTPLSLCPDEKTVENREQRNGNLLVRVPSLFSDSSSLTTSVMRLKDWREKWTGERGTLQYGQSRCRWMKVGVLRTQSG
jgi:hypothetical protein